MAACTCRQSSPQGSLAACKSGTGALGQPIVRCATWLPILCGRVHKDPLLPAGMAQESGTASAEVYDMAVCTCRQQQSTNRGCKQSAQLATHLVSTGCGGAAVDMHARLGLKASLIRVPAGRRAEGDKRQQLPCLSDMHGKRSQVSFKPLQLIRQSTTLAGAVLPSIFFVLAAVTASLSPSRSAHACVT